jgi:hypothetical protein
MSSVGSLILWPIIWQKEKWWKNYHIFQKKASVKNNIDRCKPSSNILKRERWIIYTARLSQNVANWTITSLVDQSSFRAGQWFTCLFHTKQKKIPSKILGFGEARKAQDAHKASRGSWASPTTTHSVVRSEKRRKQAKAPLTRSHCVIGFREV